MGEQIHGYAMSPAQREKMIREAAYYRAMSRGFQGDPMEDWFAAEREIDQVFPGKPHEEELAAYHGLRERVGKLLAKARVIDAKAIDRAIDSASEALTKTEKYTAETIAKGRASLRKEMIWVAERLGSQWDDLSEKSADLFAVWRDRSQVFLADAAEAVGDWLKQTGGKLEHRRYWSSEMAATGVLECVSCGRRIEFDAPAHVPLCPNCGTIEFRRVE